MIYIMSGIPGSGKSSYIENCASPFDKIISRDEIRFSLLKEGEDYFAHEKEVLKKFKEAIRIYDEFTEWGNIWVDATNISKKTRRRLLNCISYNDVTCVYFPPNIEKSIENNSKREGKYRVPTEVIISQANRFETPTVDEGFKYVVEVKY